MGSSRILPLALGLVACGGPPAAGPETAPRTPRAMAVLLLEDGITKAHPDTIRGLVGTHYRQHNPRVPDGPQGLVGMVESFAAAPISERPLIRVLRSATDGDFVITHSEFVRGGVKIVGFDMFKVEGDRFVEHWDAGMGQVARTPSGHTMIDGPTETADLAATGANKALAKRFVAAIIAKDMVAFDACVAGDVVQHAPDVADGAAAWKAALRKDEPDAARHDELLRVVGEGHFVFTQSRGHVGARPAVLYDLFRMKDGRVVEHWNVFEEIPDHAENPNGMF